MKKYITPSLEIEMLATEDIMSVSNGVQTNEENETINSILGIDSILGNK